MHESYKIFLFFRFFLLFDYFFSTFSSPSHSLLICCFFFPSFFLLLGGVTKGGGARGDVAPQNLFSPPPIFCRCLLCSNFQRPHPENQKATVECALKIYFLYRNFQNFQKFRGASPPRTPFYL